MKRIWPIMNRKNRLLMLLLLSALLAAGVYLALRDNSRTISLAQLHRLQKRQLVTRLVQKDPYLYVHTLHSRYRIPLDAVDLRSLAAHYPVEYASGAGSVLVPLGLLILLAGAGALAYRFRRPERPRPVSETSKATGESESFEPIRSPVRFRDVAGMEEAKAELEEIIDFMHHPKKYAKLGVHMPRGVLLAGPPGVGKTHLAKAVAGEAGVPFFYQSGANFARIYVGTGPKRVHELFQAAKRTAPSIIFIDEIDAVGKSRGGERNDEREATLNQLLTEMDGFEGNSGVVVLAATNRIEMLDDALLRPGRFDRRVRLRLPDQKEREAILGLYLRDKPHRVDLGALAQATVGFSSAALETLVNEAALHALRRSSSEIEEEDFEAVREKVLSGRRRIISLREEERRIQAVYQSGKAVAATWFDLPYERIGIVTTQLRESEREISSRSDYLARLKVYLAGTAATKEVLGEPYSNGAEDLRRARELARRMILELGLGEGVLPEREEIQGLLVEAMEEVGLLLRKLETARSRIESFLLEHENITRDEARSILRELF